MYLGKIKSWASSMFQGKEPELCMFEDADDITFNLTPDKIENYTNAYTKSDAPALNINLGTGEISIWQSGIYIVKVYLFGDQGLPAVTGKLFLQLDIDGVKETIAVYDSTTTTDAKRVFSAELVKTLNAGEVLSLFGVASADLGTFSIDTVSFTVVKKV